MEYQRIAAVVFSSFLVRASDGSGTVGGGWRGLVFGTLLGPEATGPLAAPVGGCWWDFVSGFLAAPITHGFVCGVCGLGLLFENYIVDASILYKKQFPRI